MMTLIQAAEIWRPDADATLLEFAAGLYPSAPEFGLASSKLCFGRAEGLPGRAWDEARPILLTELSAANFRRAAAARQAGFVCAVALPVYRDERLQAVVVLYCGELPGTAGAVELWRNDPRITGDMTLAEGYYGATAPLFAEASRETYLPRGSGLPGLAWQRQAAVFVDGLHEAPKFLRAEAAAQSGIRRGLALPCPLPGDIHYALALLSSEAAPVARRVECWVPAESASGLRRRHGHCEVAGALPVDGPAGSDSAGGCIAEALASGLPQIRQRAADEPGAVGASAAAAGLGGLLVLPVVGDGDGEAGEAVALYF